MGAGAGEVLTFAIGVAISPVPIIAVIMMLFSRRARVNGPVFLAATGLAQLGLSTADAVGSIVLFVIVGSLTIAVPVVYYLLGGEQAKTQLDAMKGWLAMHNAAVMAVLFLVFGVDLIAKGLPPLTD